jgi:hypothetical protein
MAPRLATQQSKDQSSKSTTTWDAYPRKTATPASRLPRSLPAAARTSGRDPDGFDSATVITPSRYLTEDHPQVLIIAPPLRSCRHSCQFVRALDIASRPGSGERSLSRNVRLRTGHGPRHEAVRVDLLLVSEMAVTAVRTIVSPGRGRPSVPKVCVPSPVARLSGPEETRACAVVSGRCLLSGCTRSARPRHRRTRF